MLLFPYVPPVYTVLRSQAEAAAEVGGGPDGLPLVQGRVRHDRARIERRVVLHRLSRGEVMHLRA